MDNGWVEISNFFVSAAVMRRREWGCDFPPVDALPSEALDDEVSIWCAIMAKDMDLPLDAPEPIRPWILARLVSCATEALLEDNQGKSAPQITADLVGRMLVDDWDTTLRGRWNLLVIESLSLAH